MRTKKGAAWIAWLSAAVWGSALTAFGQPVIEYRFDDVANLGRNTGTLQDLANATPSLSVVRSTDNAPFGFGDSAEFDGASSFLRVPNGFSYGDQVTVEAWIKPDLVNVQRVIWDDYGSPGVLLAVKAGGVQFGVSTTSHPGLGVSAYGGRLETNTWQHVAGVYDGRQLKVYINGVDPGGAAEASGVIVENGSSPAIGSDNITTTALNFKGRMDDFRIHLRALKPEELAGGVFSPLRIWALPSQSVVLSWAVSDGSYRLEQAGTFNQGGWKPVTNEPVLLKGYYWVTNTALNDRTWYRLVWP
jgi:hypothetical protein